MVKRKRLIWQLYPSFVLLVLGALLATGWYASHATRSFYMAQTREDLLRQARLLTPQLKPYLKPLQAAPLDLFCKHIMRNVHTRMTVVLTNGRVVADSDADPRMLKNHADRPEIITALTGSVATSLRLSETMGHHMMYLALPVQNGEVSAVIRVSIALTAVEQQLHNLHVRFFMGGVVVALIASAVCLLLSRRISQPIEALRRSAARFAQGDLSHRITPPDTAELAALAQAMNMMAHELELRIMAIEQQRNESKAVLSSMVEGVVALDSDECILHLNAAAARLLSGTPDQFQGRSIQEVMRNRELHQMIQAAMAKGDVTGGDVALYQNSEIIISARCSPLLDAGGGERGDGVVLVMNDVTQLRRLETIRSDFAANVSHEIKTPLTAIQGFVETLCDGAVADPDEAQKFLQIIARHVKRLAAIVDDLMQLARLEQDEQRRRLHLKSDLLCAMLSAAEQLCRPKADEKNITIQINCDQSLSAPIDADLMEQAAVNLIDNAIKYSAEGSSISVQAMAVDERIQIRFQDQGIGIAEKHLPRLFERFYRVDKARSRRVGGTGLGLSIVKHIVQAHEGTVTVESTLGKGSTFTIHLPRATP